MNDLIQTLAGTVGAVGFAMLFNVHGKKLGLIALGSLVSWGCFLLCRGAGIFYAFFCATCAAALISEVLARVAKGPVLLFLVPMLIPLIPGSDLYYTMSYLVNGERGLSLHHAILLLSEAGAIALGIICAAAIAKIVLTILLHRKKP